MPDPDLEQLRRSIQKNLEALDQILHRQAEQEPERPKLQLIKGGALGIAILAGVEWLRRHREVMAALATAGVAVAAGAVVWMIWPDREPSPSVRPPAETSTVTITTPAPQVTRTSPRTPAPPRTVPTTIITQPGTTGRSATEAPEPSAPVPAALSEPSPTTASPTGAPEPPPRGRGTLPTPPPSTKPPAAKPTCVHLHIPDNVGVCLPSVALPGLR